jgi:hypothetical protein
MGSALVPLWMGTEPPELRCSPFQALSFWSLSPISWYLSRQGHYLVVCCFPLLTFPPPTTNAPVSEEEMRECGGSWSPGLWLRSSGLLEWRAGGCRLEAFPSCLPLNWEGVAFHLSLHLPEGAER